jgi:hypothetical protein
MRFLQWLTGFAGLMIVSFPVAAQQRVAPISLPSHQSQMTLASLLVPATITWLELDRSVQSARVVEASWSRGVMATLADRVAADGTRYIQLPLVRIYDARGNRLKLADDITDPRVAADRIQQALARMEVDEAAPTLAEDMGVLQTGLDAGAAMPPARAYVIDYWADWCRTSGPFHAALDSWQASVQAQDVVVIKAAADFGRQSIARQ